jgi:hypothetical protein
MAELFDELIPLAVVCTDTAVECIARNCPTLINVGPDFSPQPQYACVALLQRMKRRREYFASSQALTSDTEQIIGHLKFIDSKAATEVEALIPKNCTLGLDQQINPVLVYRPRSIHRYQQI